MSTERAPSRLRDPGSWLLLTALLALGVALIGPAPTLERAVFRHLLVFDITQSMNVPDTEWRGRPTPRLEFAKHAAAHALSSLPCGSSIGLGVFTGHRTFALSTPVEVCANYGELTRMIEAIDWRMAWIWKSEIAKGIHSALLTTERMGGETSLIFFTDGHEAPPIHPDFRPEFGGDPGHVRGAIAGIGGLNPVAIPKLDMNGRQHGTWRADEVLQVDTYTLGRATSVARESMEGIERDALAERMAHGTEHLSSLHEPYLEQLARELGLAYRRVRTERGLVSLMTSPQYAVRRATRADLRWLAGLAALAALAAVYMLAGRSRDRAH